jgi:hypothetical protein
MFDEDNLHSLIWRESNRRHIRLGKLLRETLVAAAAGRFAVFPVPGGGHLVPNWRDGCRRLAALAEYQNDRGWWQGDAWRWLTLLLVKTPEYLKWLDVASGTPAISGDKDSPIQASFTTGRKGGEKSPKAVAWKIAEGILLDEEKRPPRGHGRLTALARAVQPLLKQEGYPREIDTIAKDIRPSFHDWERRNPGK